MGKLGRMNDRRAEGLERAALAALSSALAQAYGRAVAPAVVVPFGSRALAATLKLNVDLVDLLSVPSHLVSQALRHGRILSGARTPALDALIARMVAEREDIAPCQRRILEERVR